MRVMAPGHVVAAERDQPLLVNVFNGSERTAVSYRILPDGEWRDLAFTPGVDTDYIGRLWQRDHAETPPPGTRLPPPALSRHLWQTRLPRSLPVGSYEIEVRVRDEWGREFHARRPLEVHPSTVPFGRN